MAVFPVSAVDRWVARPKGSTAEPSPATLAARRRIGASIRAAREALAWTLDQLAQETDVDPAQIARVEAGQTNVTFHVLHRIAQGLHLAIALVPATGRRKAHR